MTSDPAATGTVPRPDGLVLAPLRALRYDSSVDLAKILAPPYDVITADRRQELADRDAHNVVRLTLPQPGQATTEYESARDTLQDWRGSGVLTVDPEPALYVYEQVQPDGHVQRGLLGAIGLTPPEDGIVAPHEDTMAGPVADRLALMGTTEADLEAIVLLYDGGGAAGSVVADVTAHEPTAEVTDDAGTVHRLWPVVDPTVLKAMAEDLHARRTVIADGHHRYATFRAYQAQRHAAGDGPGPWDFGLALLVDATAFGPQVHPIHRSVANLTLRDAVERARVGMRAEHLDGADAAAPGSWQETLAATTGTAFVITDGTDGWLLADPDPDRIAAAMPPERSQAWRGLDVAVAHKLLIAALWGLPDDEQTVRYHHDAQSAVAAARAEGGVAILLKPTPVDAVATVAAAGDRMPRKSTLFVPKPASGLVMRVFADQAGLPGL